MVSGIAVAVAVLIAGPAVGHAIVDRTDPAIDEVVARSPAFVSMFFNEPVEIDFGAIRVLDTNGRQVDLGEPQQVAGDPASVRVGLRPDLPKGTYTVTWRVISADGHPIQEAYVFHVREPGKNPLGIGDRILGEGGAGRLTGVLYGIARWISLASLLLLVGCAIFVAAVWDPSASRSYPPPEVTARFRRLWRRVAAAAWAGAVIGSVASFLLQAAVAADVPVLDAFSLSLLADVAGTRFGLVMLARLGLLAAIGIAFWVLGKRTLRPGPVDGSRSSAPPSRWLVALAVIASLGLLLSPGLAGHAGTTPPAAANLAADALHLAAGAAWVAGLAILVLAVFPATKVMATHDRVRILAPTVSRFSDMATVAVGVLVVSGIFRSWIEVGAWRALVGTTYGLVLLTKVAAFLPMVGLGAVNRFWAKPRLARAVEAPGRGPGAMSTIRRLITVELVLAVVVIGVTASLVNIAPGRVAAGLDGPFTTEIGIGHDNLNLVVDPNRVGENEVHLRVTDETGAPAHVEDAWVLFRMPSEQIGPLVAEAVFLDHGHHVVQGHQLSVAGEWELEIVLRTGDFQEERTTVRIIVNG